MEAVREWAELALLVIVLLMSVGRWAQKQEETPVTLSALRDTVEKNHEEFRRHKHWWNNWLNTHGYELDKVYARKETVNVQVEALCERISRLEESE